jgi:hypothetical protein
MIISLIVRVVILLSPQAGGPPLAGCTRLFIHYIPNYPPYLEISILSDYRLDYRSTGIRSWQRQRIFPLAFMSLRPIQVAVQLEPDVLYLGLKCNRGVTLTTHPHLVSRSRMSRSYTSLPCRLYGGCGTTFLLLRLQSLDSVMSQWQGIHFTWTSSHLLETFEHSSLCPSSRDPQSVLFRCCWNQAMHP